MTENRGQLKLRHTRSLQVELAARNPQRLTRNRQRVTRLDKVGAVLKFEKNEDKKQEKRAWRL